MKRLIASCLVALLAVGAVASAQTAVSAQLAVSWTAPTVDANGAALTTLTAVNGYKLWVDTAAIPDAPTAMPTASVGAVTSTTATVSATVGATLHVRVQACNQFGCGALAQEQTILVQGAAPGVPTSVKLTITLS